MKPLKKKSKTKSKCDECIKSEITPIWEHTLCSYHRDCSGKDDWEPNNCTNCKRQKAALAKISVEDRTSFFQEMYDMLEKTKQYKDHTVNVDWEYNEILKGFLDKYEVPPLTENVNEEINNSNDLSQDHIDQSIRNDTIYENSDREIDNRTYSNEYDDPYNEDDGNDEYYPEYDYNDYYTDNDLDQNHYDESFREVNMNVHNTGNDHPLGGAQSYFSEGRSTSRENYITTNPFPMNYQNQPLDQHRFLDYDNYGRQIPYNIANNDNFHRGPHPYFVPGAAAPIHSFTPIHLQPHNFGGQPHKYHEVDPTTGETWLYFDQVYHTKKDNNKIEMWTPDGPKLINVQYRIGNPNQFKTMTTTAAHNLSPFIDGREGHSVLLNSFNRSVSTNDFGATKRIAFETRLDAGSGLATTLDLIKRFDTNMTESIFDHNLKELHDHFPKSAFDAVSLADFTSGWNISSSSFVAFAKDQELVVKALNRQLNINVNFNVAKHLLTQERDAKRRIVNTLTSLHLLDLFSEKIDSMDEHIKRTTRLSSSQTKAIARTMLPNFKGNIITWMIAKMRVRKAVLKNHSHSNNLKLLRSSLWDEHLFPKSITDELLDHAGRNMAPLLGLDVATSSKSNNYPSNTSKKSYHFDRNNQFNRANNPYQTQNQTFRENQTFRDQSQGGAQKQPQIYQKRSNSTQQAKIPTRGKFNSPGNRNRGQSNRGKSPYTRPTSAYKNTQNK